jgi:hypothetical protein
MIDLTLYDVGSRPARALNGEPVAQQDSAATKPDTTGYTKPTVNPGH